MKLVILKQVFVKKMLYTKVLSNVFIGFLISELFVETVFNFISEPNECILVAFICRKGGKILYD